MDATYASIILLPLLIGLTEAIKRAVNLDARHVPLVAVGLGLLVGLIVLLASPPPVTLAGVAAAVVQGLALGLGAVGLYSGARNVAKP